MSKVVEGKVPGLINCNMELARPQFRLWTGFQITGHCGLERRRGLWEGFKRSLTNHEKPAIKLTRMLWWQGWKRMEMEFESHREFPCGSLWTGLSDFQQSAWSRKECERKQTLKKKVPRVVTLLVASSTPISILHRHFWCSYSNSRDVVCKLSFLFLPHRPSATESLLAGYTMLSRWLTKEVDKIEFDNTLSDWHSTTVFLKKVIYCFIQ